MEAGVGVYQRSSDGRWCAAVTLPGRRRVIKYAPTQKAAILLRDQMTRDLHLHTLAPPSRLTLETWFGRWLAQKERRPKTVASYQDSARPFLQRLGKVRLSSLSVAQLEWALLDLRRAGVGTSTVQHGWRVLRACLRAAVRQRLLGDNPTDRLEPPSHRRSPQQALTAAEVDRFVATAQQSTLTHAPLLLFILGTGLRTAEVTGLCWGDVAPTTVTVRQTQVEVRGHHTPGTPKTEAGHRTLALTGVARTALSARTPGPLRGRVFTSQTGTVPYQRNLLRTLQTLCRQAQVPLVSPHDLRRTHASLMAGAGVDVAVLQRRLGHSRASVTLDVYTRPVHPDQTAATAFDRLLTPPTSSPS